MNDTSTESDNAKPPFPAFAETEQSAGYKIFLTIRSRLEQEGKLTEEADRRLLQKAEAARARLQEHLENKADPGSATE